MAVTFDPIRPEQLPTGPANMGMAATVPLNGSKPVSLPGLTGLRGIGALWVLLYHAQVGMNLPVFGCGYLGVDLFFILSGFILSHAHPEIVWTWPEYVRFVRMRAARISPMHWVALATVCLVIWNFPEIRAHRPGLFRTHDLIANIFLVQNWGFSPGTWNVPAWSLSVEWLVSLAFPLFLASSRRVVRPQTAMLLCYGCLLLYFGMLVMTHNLTLDVSARGGIVRAVCEFAAGCLLYRCRNWWSRGDAAIALVTVALIAAGVLVSSVRVLAVLGLPLLIMLAGRQSGRVAWLFSRSTIVFLGEISYSVYLLHWILLSVFYQRHAALNFQDWGAVGWFAGYLGLVLILSTLSYRFIEIPARNWLRGPRRPVAERRCRPA